MRLKTIHAEDMQRAMDQVRYEFGEDAVIISTNRNPLGKGVSITIAQTDDDDEEPMEDLATAPPASSPAREPRAPAPHNAIPDYFIRDIELILERNGTSPEAIDAITREARLLPKPRDDSEESIQGILAEAIRHTYRFQPVSLMEPGLRVMLIGAPGVGKTLTAAKIISRMVKAGHKVYAITTDCKRTGGVEQLAGITDILGVELQVAETRAEIKSMLADIPKEGRVVIDSAGANPYDFHELKELAEFAGLLEIEPVLVYAAGGDPVEASEISQAFSFLGVERVIITRTDVARRYGSLLTAAHAANLAFGHLTGTEKVLGEFGDITPELLTELLMRHRRD